VPEANARLKAIAEPDGSSRLSHRNGCLVNMEIIRLKCDKLSGAISIATTSIVSMSVSATAIQNHFMIRMLHEQGRSRVAFPEHTTSYARGIQLSAPKV
jgi:hypothetical protein